MDVAKFVMNFAATWWFRPGGRYLVPSEVEGINSIMHGGKKVGDQFRYTTEKLRDPNREQKSTQVLQDFTYDQKVGLIYQVAHLYKQLQKEDPEALARYKSLRGLWVLT